MFWNQWLTGKSAKREQPKQELGRTLKDELTVAIQTRCTERALEILIMLEAIERDEPRWPHKRAELLRSAGENIEAAAAYARAAQMYQNKGFGGRAGALTSLATTLQRNASASGSANSASTLH